MTEITLDSFKETLDVLIDANAHARNKGDEFKDWIKKNFDCDARISYVKEQRQITNRVSEQFRYFAPVVVFVCVSEVKRDTLIKYILERGYKQLENVVIIGATSSDGEKNYAFETLIIFKQSSFTEWAKPFFDSFKDANSLKEEFGLAVDDEEDGDDQEIVVDESERITDGENVLLYGVPGSGKSWIVEKEYCDDESRMERLVFHPDYTHSDFIGQILPNVADGIVSYKFTEGPFTSMLKKAYTHPDKMFFLVIEEINRGNAPAIFGEVFQLLDRDNDGTSEYGITNVDIATIVYGNLNRKVRIPSNMSIIGTMNTSDQNVFTLDTAFQRRWNMRMIENTFRGHGYAATTILDTNVTWQRFCEVINNEIVTKNIRMTSSEDKRLGTYFVRAADLEYHEEADNLELSDRERIVAKLLNYRFAEKVLKYLWDDAFKFSREDIFKNTIYKSLEEVINHFNSRSSAKAVGNSRLDVFKEEVIDAFLAQGVSNNTVE